MEKLVKSCAYNIDSGCVEIVFDDGGVMFVDCNTVEDEIADNRFERSELDYLIYNDPVSYVNLILSGEVESYLKRVTNYSDRID